MTDIASTADTACRRLADCAAALWLEAGPGAVSFGQVSARTGLQKSLAAYHFPTVAALRAAAADRVLSDFCNRVRIVAEELAAYSPKEASGPRIWAQLAMQALGHQRHGLAILEIAFLALDDADYRRRIVRLAAGLRRIVRCLGAGRQPREPRTAFALVVGALLTHAARGHGPHHLFALDRELEEAFAGPGLPRHRHRKPGVGPAPSVAGPPVTTPREQILDAAIDLLADDALRAMSHRSLARQAGLSLSATTYYFASKTEIFEAALERLIERAQHALANSGSSAGPTSWDMDSLVETLTEFYLEEGQAATRAHLNIGLLAGRTPSMHAAMEDFYALQIANFIRLLGEAGTGGRGDRTAFLYKLISGHLMLSLLDM